MISGASRAANIIKRALESITFVCFHRQRSLRVSRFSFTWARVKLCISRMAVRVICLLKMLEQSLMPLKIEYAEFYCPSLPAIRSPVIKNEVIEIQVHEFSLGNVAQSRFMFVLMGFHLEIHPKIAKIIMHEETKNEIATLCIETGANEHH